MAEIQRIRHLRGTALQQDQHRPCIELPANNNKILHNPLSLSNHQRTLSRNGQNQEINKHIKLLHPHDLNFQIYQVPCFSNDGTTNPRKLDTIPIQSLIIKKRVKRLFLP